MARAIIGVMDSFGVGAADDADAFGDAGANTYGHIRAACAAGEADAAGLRQGPLATPNLTSLGLATADEMAAGAPGAARGAYGFAAERSFGKDTPSGHWEMMGLPVEFDWGYFPKDAPTFPPQLIADLIAAGDLPGVLGERHASGTQIIDELGESHIATGKPIVYTSADSVLQIAAHETHFGLARLLDLCAKARELVDAHNIGRVIARPFVGERPGEFKRTGNRKDIATPPHGPTLLDVYAATGRPVIGVGKISDIFAGSGVTEVIKADGNDALFDATLKVMDEAPDDAIIFTNFVDFDTLFGHRRNVAGYAAALEAFDARLPELEAKLKPGDVALLSADHGCDPTWPGSDHTREFIPILSFGPSVKPGFIGKRRSFADIGQTLAGHLGVGPLAEGESFLADLIEGDGV
ncbi:MAG: phosphopentomutase [Pseudomonadota bacterium]